jgi:hypothetical protein
VSRDGELAQQEEINILHELKIHWDPHRSPPYQLQLTM